METTAIPFLLLTLVTMDTTWAQGLPEPRDDDPGTALPFVLVQRAMEYVSFGPKKRNINEKKLLAKLGEDFKPMWMSVRQPTGTEVLVMESNRSRDAAEDLEQMLDQAHFPFAEQHPNDLQVEATRSFREWLLDLAGCPVRFVWQDLGSLFWPRWIRNGVCPRRGCSWPPGMQCVPAEGRPIRLLRWHCRGRNESSSRRRGKDKRRRGKAPPLHVRTGETRRRHGRLKCRWLKIPYPITDECFCSC